MKRHILHFWSWLKKVRPQYWIAAICILIVVLRMLIPSLIYDAESRNLLLIAMICVLIPDLARLVARVKKLKIGDNEIELGEALDDLAQKTQKAEEHLSEPSQHPYARMAEAVAPNIEKYLKDPRGGLIAVAVDIEERVQHLVKEHNIDGDKRYLSPMQGAEMLSRKGIVVRDLPMLMKDFWVVRNRAFHSSEVRLTEKDVYRLVDLGVRILDLLSITRAEG